MFSANHYHQDTRFVKCKAESTIFRLPLSPLKASCPILGHLVDPVVQGENSVGDGVSDCCELKSVSAVEFETFMDYVYPANPPKRFSVDELQVILKLSDMYGAGAGRLYAIKHLSEQEDEITPAKLLSMSVKYKVPRWFKTSYQTLASIPLHAADPFDLGAVPPQLLHRLLTTRHVVDAIRWELAVRSPDMYHSRLTAFNCQREGGCADIMVGLWDQTARPLLARSWYSHETVLKMLLSKLAEADVCSCCRDIYKLNFEHLFLKEPTTIAQDAQDAFNEQGFTEDD